MPKRNFITPSVRFICMYLSLAKECLPITEHGSIAGALAVAYSDIPGNACLRFLAILKALL